MNCPDVRPLLQAYSDRELDLVRQLEIEGHLAGCAACAAQEKSLGALREAVASPALRYRAPAALERRLRSAAPTPAPRRRRLSIPIVPAAVAALLLVGLAAFGIVLSRNRGSVDDRLAEAVVASHVRSLQVDHLTDVVSSDRHTVKPWFRGHLDFAPSVPDLSSDGYPLTGGRLDYVAGRPVSAVVYHRRLHAINLLMWPDDAPDVRQAERLQRQGFRIRHWRQSGMSCWGISDLNDPELDEFVRLFRASAGDQGTR